MLLKRRDMTTEKKCCGIAQKVENLQQPKCSAPHRNNKHFSWCLTRCKLGSAWIWLVRLDGQLVINNLVLQLNSAFEVSTAFIYSFYGLWMQAM